MTSLPVVAFVASPLQLASFKSSVHANRDTIIVGHRGMKGDVEYRNPVLNDAEFLTRLDDLFGARDVEVFLPNSVNGLFFLCACHPQVKRISYVDEGRLTWKFLENHQRRRRNPGSAAMRFGFNMVRNCPRAFRPFLYRLLCAVLKRAFAAAFMKEPETYRYRTIDRHWKHGRILCHAPVSTIAPDVEVVDLFKALEFPDDYAGAACIFLHPRMVRTDAESLAIVRGFVAAGSGSSRVLIRPHPLFSTFRSRLDAFRLHLERAGIYSEEALLSEQQETAIELYARGVRTFVLTSDSTVGYTARFFPSFFKDLRVIYL